MASAIQQRVRTAAGGRLPTVTPPASRPARVFSIALPVKGQAEFLPVALASIAAQSVTVNLSVMDATHDDSVHRVLAKCGVRVHYSRHGADRGQAAAIKEGWDRAPGDVVGWLGADDCLFPDALAMVERAFRDHPDADVVYGDCVFIDRQGGFIRYFPSISSDIRRITRDCCIAQPSCFVRREALDRLGGIRADLHFVMDWDLWTRLHLAGCRFHYLPHPLSASRMHPGTKTTSNSRDRLKEIWRHLHQHNPRRTAIRSMAGVCIAPLAYRELGRFRSDAPSRLISVVRAIGAARTPPKQRSDPPYGLATGTNAVEARCTIHIPHYGDSAPTHLVVITRRDANLAASLDEIALSQTVCTAPGRTDPSARHVRPATRRHVFELPAPRDGGRHAFRFDLWSSDGRAWALVHAQLACMPFATRAPQCGTMKVEASRSDVPGNGPLDGNGSANRQLESALDFESYAQRRIAALHDELMAKERVISELAAAVDALRTSRVPLTGRLRRVATRSRAALWRRFGLAPKLGVLEQHAPRPLRVPRPPRRCVPRGLPQISLVTPSFRHGRFLERTLLSVLAQQYPRLEYVVQDGGSDDGSLEILHAHAPRLARWASERDSGQSQAINRGFASTSGDVMGWLNSDDLLLPGALQRVGEVFRQHPEIDVVYGNRVLIDQRDMCIGRWILPGHDGEVLSWADYVPQETLFWRRRAWERAGGHVDESFRFAMDWDLLVRMRDAGARFMHVPHLIGAFRVHPAQKTADALLSVGAYEMDRIRSRIHGRVPHHTEIHRHLGPFLRRHVHADLLHEMHRRATGLWWRPVLRERGTKP
jgi:glycosyltransferase involved in cell wall biosynthesis